MFKEHDLKPQQPISTKWHRQKDRQNIATLISMTWDLLSHLFIFLDLMLTVEFLETLYTVSNVRMDFIQMWYFTLLSNVMCYCVCLKVFRIYWPTKCFAVSPRAIRTYVIDQRTLNILSGNTCFHEKEETVLILFHLFLGKMLLIKKYMLCIHVKKRNWLVCVYCKDKIVSNSWIILLIQTVLIPIIPKECPKWFGFKTKTREPPPCPPPPNFKKWMSVLEAVYFCTLLSCDTQAHVRASTADSPQKLN